MGTDRLRNGRNSGSETDARLDEIFLAYRSACPEPEAGPNFMPGIWAGIEAREVSNNWFGRFAKALVTAAIAASVILGMMTTSSNQSSSFFNATFVEALRADQAASLEPLHVDRISYLEQQ
jgi:hypothetical protein